MIGPPYKICKSKYWHIFYIFRPICIFLWSQSHGRRRKRWRKRRNPKVLSILSLHAHQCIFMPVLWLSRQTNIDPHRHTLMHAQILMKFYLQPNGAHQHVFVQCLTILLPVTAISVNVYDRVWRDVLFLAHICPVVTVDAHQGVIRRIVSLQSSEFFPCLLIRAQEQHSQCIDWNIRKPESSTAEG